MRASERQRASDQQLRGLQVAWPGNAVMVMAVEGATRRRPGAPLQRAPAADEIAGLWWVLLVLGAAMFLIVVTLLVAAVVRTRRAGADRRPDDYTDVPARTANRWIVVFGVAVPLAVLAATLAMSVSTMRALPGAGSEDAVRIDVVGHQWWWSAEYPDEQVTVANEIHIPVGRSVELRLLSADVIHSFWAPDLHGKLDVLPDGVNTLVVEADEAGVYRGACAEFCGRQHARMGFLVIAQPQEEYAAWLDAQRRPAAPPASAAARRGQEVFADAGCASCHTVRGHTEPAAGPDLTHLASRRTIAAATLDNTPENLARWLAEPDAVKEGTLMPAPQLSADELAAVVAYLESLE